MKKSETKRFDSVKASKTLKNLIKTFDLGSKAVLDIGCGYGQYLVHFGPRSVGITTSQAEVDFGKKENLDIRFGNAEDIRLNQTFDAIWANNLYEHLLSPHSFLMKLKKIANSNAILILGVPMVPTPKSLMKLRWWKGALASNHINFFTVKTLQLTIERAGWTILEERPFYLKSKVLDKLFKHIAPHMYIVAKNSIEFKYPPKKISEWMDDERYRDLLTITHQL